MEQIVFNTPIGKIITKGELRTFLIEDEIELCVAILDFSDDLQEQVNRRLEEKKHFVYDENRERYNKMGFSSYESLIKGIGGINIVEQVLNVRIHKDKSVCSEIWIGASDKTTELMECDISILVDISPYYFILQGMILQSVSRNFFREVINVDIVLWEDSCFE